VNFINSCCEQTNYFHSALIAEKKSKKENADEGRNPSALL